MATGTQPGSFGPYTPRTVACAKTLLKRRWEDEGDWEDGNQRGQGSELTQMEEHATQRFSFPLSFYLLAGAHLFKTLSLYLTLFSFLFFFLPPPQEKQRHSFNIERAEQISHMDMLANLGDDEAILWGLNRALWWCKLKRRPLKSGIGGLIAYALRQIKAFSEVTHLHSDITGAMGTWQPRLWTVFCFCFFE